MAQITLNSTGVASNGALVLQSNGTTTAVTVSTGQVATFANDAVVNGLTVGRGAGAVSTNTAVGASALSTNSTGASIVAVGDRALNFNTANNNTALGALAGYTNSTGSENAFLGRAAGFANTTGGSNTAVGNLALNANTTASNNTAVGYQAGYANTTGADSTFLGYLAGNSHTTGSRNTLVGFNTGSGMTTGTFNNFFGTQAGQAVTTGGKNTIIGSYSGNQGGLDIRTLSNHIVLSDGDGNPRTYWNSSGINYVGSIGSGAIETYISSTCGRVNYYNDAGATRNPLYFYYSSVEKGSISISSTATAYNTSSDYRLKNSIAPMTGALAKVAQLKPVTYKWNADGSDGEGFIAHELAEVVPQCVTGEKDAVDADGKPQYQGIDVSFLVATLTAAIKELKAEFDAYKSTHP